MKPTEQQLDQFVRQNVSLCVSSLVATLANASTLSISRSGSYGVPSDSAAVQNETAMRGLIDQALELSLGTEDYAEAAWQAGWTETPEGWWWREPQTEEEAERADFMFLGSGPYLKENCASDACDFDKADPYQWEIYEHWAVNEWLAEKLEAKGERVDRDFAGLCVWGRTCTGQSISMDGVIVEICAEALS